MLLIHYDHYDCPKDSDVQWDDEFPSACDGECPACGTRNIVAVSWHPLRETCTPDCNTIKRAA
jgi:hypothetical protein